MSDYLEQLATLDDEITGADQENLDAIEALLEKRSALLDNPPPAPEIEEPPAPEPQIEPKEEPNVEPEPPVKTETEDEKMDRLREEYSVGELKQMAKEAGLENYSRLKEDELIKLLIAHGQLQ